MDDDEINLIKQHVAAINGYNIAVLDNITNVCTKNNVTSQNITISQKNYLYRLTHIVVPTRHNFKKIISVGLSLKESCNQFSSIPFNLLLLLGKLTTIDNYHIIDLPDGLIFRSNRDIELLEFDFVLDSHGNNAICYKIILQHKMDPGSRTGECCMHDERMSHCISSLSPIPHFSYFYTKSQYIINNFNAIKCINTDIQKIIPTTAITGFFIKTDTMITNVCISVDNLLPSNTKNNVILICDHDSIESFGQLFLDPVNETVKKLIRKILSTNLCSDIIDNIIQLYIPITYLYWIPIHDPKNTFVKKIPWYSEKKYTFHQLTCKDVDNKLLSILIISVIVLSIHLKQKQYALQTTH